MLALNTDSNTGTNSKAPPAGPAGPFRPHPVPEFAVVLYLALVIFAGLAAGCWAVSAALYRATVGGPPPGTARVTAATVLAVALTSFVPFPAGYLAGLVVWAVAAFGFGGLPPHRAALFFGYLALTSFAARLLVLGWLRFFLGP